MTQNWEFALTLSAIIAGIFFNQRAADRVRSDVMAQINTLSGRIDLITGKLMELSDRISTMEGRAK